MSIERGGHVYTGGVSSAEETIPQSTGVLFDQTCYLVRITSLLKRLRPTHVPIKTLSPRVCTKHLQNNNKEHLECCCRALNMTVLRCGVLLPVLVLIVLRSNDPIVSCATSESTVCLTSRHCCVQNFIKKSNATDMPLNVILHHRCVQNAIQTLRTSSMLQTQAIPAMVRDILA